MKKGVSDNMKFDDLIKVNKTVNKYHLFLCGVVHPTDINISDFIHRKINLGLHISNNDITMVKYSSALQFLINTLVSKNGSDYELVSQMEHIIDKLYSEGYIRTFILENKQYLKIKSVMKQKTLSKTKTYTKYDFHDDNVEVCEGLNAKKLKELGFTNFAKGRWYFCITISTNPKDDRFHETFNLTITDNFTKLESDILDEAFLQPCIPYVEYYLGEKAFEDCTPYIQKGIKKCDEYIEFLVDNNVIKFKK